MLTCDPFATASARAGRFRSQEDTPSRPAFLSYLLKRIVSASVANSENAGSLKIGQLLR
jgi:hypothetical protein